MFEDLMVKCMVFKFVNLIICVVYFCESMLVFGKVEEFVFKLIDVLIVDVVQDVVELESFVIGDFDLKLINNVV